jgi:hypothetical protein
MSDTSLLSLAPNPWARVERIAELLLLACVAALGAWAGYKLTPHAVREDVTPAPQVIQADQSVIAARAPDAHPKPAPHIIPRGYVEERRESIHIAPDVDKKDVAPCVTTPPSNKP